MRILVLSDSHRDRFALFEAIEREPEAELVYLLGDGEREMQEAADAYGDTRAFVAVRGNCDFVCPFPAQDVRSVGAVRIFATHGYEERVKYGLSELKRAALEAHCRIALFGHTHEPYLSYEDGIYLFNPGSVREQSYGVIDLLPAGILPAHKIL